MDPPSFLLIQPQTWMKLNDVSCSYWTVLVLCFAFSSFLLATKKKQFWFGCCDRVSILVVREILFLSPSASFTNLNNCYDRFLQTTLTLSLSLSLSLSFSVSHELNHFDSLSPSLSLTNTIALTTLSHTSLLSFTNTLSTQSQYNTHTLILSLSHFDPHASVLFSSLSFREPAYHRIDNISNQVLWLTMKALQLTYHYLVDLNFNL